jgi:SWI/SNF-related matrix-associated actin-dependent regulator 1 of chromatin subfamily A
MPGAIFIGHSESMVTLLPMQGQLGKQFLLDGPATLDRGLGRYTLSVQDLPALVESAEAAGVQLNPSGTLAPWLRDIAGRLRAQAEHISTIPGLYPFQQEGVAFLHNGRERLLFDEMGLGKTPQSLAALNPEAPGMVLGPSVMCSTWAAEAAKWCPSHTPVIIKSRAAFHWPEPGELVIVTYDKVPQEPDKFGKVLPGTQAVADEAQMVKNWTALRTKAFRKLSRRVRKVDGGTVWLLTGTPLQNNPSELWAMLQALELGKRLYGSHSKFVQLFGGVVDGLGQVEWDPTAVHPKAMDPIRPYALRRVRKDVLPQLPPKMRQTIQVAPPAAAARAMDKAWAEHAHSLDELLERLGNGEHLAGDRKGLAEHKIPALMELVQQYEAAGEPLVVFSAHRAPVEALQQRQGWAAILGGSTGRGTVLERFQAGELKGLACTIRAAGTGLTLTRAANVVFVDRDWNPAANMQAEDRVYRIKQDRKVTIIDIVCDHPLDRAVTEMLTHKLDYHNATTSQLDQKFIPRDRYTEAEKLEAIAHAIETA